MINDCCAEISMHDYSAQVLMITKLTTIWGNNYEGGREYHNLIVDGNNISESVWHCSCVKCPSLES